MGGYNDIGGAVGQNGGEGAARVLHALNQPENE